MKPRRVLPTALAALTSLLLGVPLGLSGAAADTPTGTLVSPANVASGIREHVYPLAGEASRLVYEQTKTLGSGAAAFGAAGDSQLEAYDGAGAPVDIGPVPIVEGGLTYSLAGPMLTAGNPYSLAVLWWNLDDHTSGTLTLPGSWAGSSGDGAYYTVDDDVYDEATSGVSRLIGSPFVASGEAIVAATAGPNGLVLGGTAGGLAYLTLDGNVTRLHSAWGKYASNDNALRCGVTTRSDTVCEVDLDGGDANIATTVQLVPLDGSAPAPVADTCFGSAGGPSAAITAHRLICADDGVTSQLLTPGARTTSSSYTVGGTLGLPGVVGALGTAVVTSPAATALETVSSAVTAPRPLLTAAASPVTAEGFALTSGRVVWASNQRVAGQSPTLSSVRQASVAASGASLRTGASQLLAPRTGWQYVYASDDTTAYTSVSAANGLRTESLRVVTPERTTTVHRIALGKIAVSGNRVLYLVAQRDGYPSSRYLLLNAATAKRTPVAVLDHQLALNPRLTISNVSGSYVAYIASTGAVKRLSLATGTTTTVASARAGRRASAVFTYGPYVGWTQTNDGGSGAYFRNATTMGPVTTLPAHTEILAMTNSGIVTGTVEDAHGIGNGNQVVANHEQIRGYRAGSAVSSLLIAPQAQSNAQVSDSVVAWLDADHVVRAAAIGSQPITALPLGAPFAPRSEPRSGQPGWRPSIAFSAALSSCQITISNGRRTVRVLPCAAADMTRGVATATWNARSTAGPLVARGTYTWAATVTGTSSTTETVTGTVSIT